MESLVEHIETAHLDPRRQKTLNDETSDESRPFKCNYPNCYAGFESAQDVTLHQQSSNHFFKECAVCGESFTQMGALYKHAGVAHFTTAQDMDKQRQMQILHNMKCALCDKTFTDVKSLQRHTNTIHINKTYQCSVCKKNLKRKDSLMRHIKFLHSEIVLKDPAILNFE